MWTRLILVSWLLVVVPLASIDGGPGDSVMAVLSPRDAKCGDSMIENQRPYFDKAAWLWDPICPNPELDENSNAFANLLSQDYHGANLWAFGVTLRGPEGITKDTPRHKLTFAKVPEWGSDPFEPETMPITTGTPIPPGKEGLTDGHLAVADPVSKLVLSLWQAETDGSTWKASWGAKTPLDGDGRETKGSSTGSGLSRFAAVVRVSEIKAGHIPHALFFATNMASKQYRYPATKSDGTNKAGVEVPIPEGARLQLDPTIDVDSIKDITHFERTIAKALQTYGAYCGDNGDARIAIICEFEGGMSPGATYATAGATCDPFELKKIPWDRLRVLKTWNGKK